MAKHKHSEEAEEERIRKRVHTSLENILKLHFSMPLDPKYKHPYPVAHLDVIDHLWAVLDNRSPDDPMLVEECTDDEQEPAEPETQ